MHLHQIGINNLYQLWYNIPQLNDKLRGIGNNNNNTLVLGYTILDEDLNDYARLCHDHFMFITKQSDILPPHLEEDIYDVNMLLEEIFSNIDTEMSYQLSESDSNNSTREEYIVDEKKDNETVHQVMNSTSSASSLHNMHQVIIDSGADCHIGGKHWLPLSPTTGTNVKHASILGFCSDEEINGLLIVNAITKTTSNKGEVVIIRSHHLIYNSTSNTMLLSLYELHEAGVVIDDISLHHLHKDGQMGTQSLYFKNGVQISLFSQATLLTFNAELPTFWEYTQALHGKLKIIDIGIKNWDPRHQSDNIVNFHCLTSSFTHNKILQYPNNNDDYDVNTGQIFSRKHSRLQRKDAT